MHASDRPSDDRARRRVGSEKIARRALRVSTSDLPGTEEQRQHEGQDDRERGGSGRENGGFCRPRLGRRDVPVQGSTDAMSTVDHACHRERHEEPHEPVLRPRTEGLLRRWQLLPSFPDHVVPRGRWGRTRLEVGPRRNGRQLGIHRLRNARGCPEGRQGRTRSIDQRSDYVESRNSLRGVCCS